MINTITNRYAPQTPVWARRALYQERGFYTTIGLKRIS